MAEFPAMPLWTDAYLGDTTHLTTIEHGAYLLLLITMWRARDNVLPDDDRLLAKYTRLSNTQWRRIRPALAPFFKIENGVWLNRRLLDEVESVRRNVRQRSDAGKASALKRKHRNATSVATNGQREVNTHTHTHNHTQQSAGEKSKSHRSELVPAREAFPADADGEPF